MLTNDLRFGFSGWEELFLLYSEGDTNCHCIESSVPVPCWGGGREGREGGREGEREGERERERDACIKY